MKNIVFGLVAIGFFASTAHAAEIRVDCTVYSRGVAQRVCAGKIESESLAPQTDLSLSRGMVGPCETGAYDLVITKAQRENYVNIRMTRTAKNIFGKIKTKVVQADSMATVSYIFNAIAFTNISNGNGLECRIEAGNK